MRLAIYRDTATPSQTEGKLFRDGEQECFTLELPIRDGKPGSAIPAGTYQIELQPSPRFLQIAQGDRWFNPYADAMPHIVGIPGRSLIMIHPGNGVSQTDGCVLVGQGRYENSLTNSRAAFAALYPFIQQAVNSGDGCQIQVVDPPATPQVLTSPDLSTQV